MNFFWTWDLNNTDFYYNIHVGPGTCSGDALPPPLHPRI